MALPQWRREPATPSGGVWPHGLETQVKGCRMGPSPQPGCSQTLLCPALTPKLLRPPWPPCVRETDQAPCSPCSHCCLERSVPCCASPSTHPFDVPGGLAVRSFPVPPHRLAHRWAQTPRLLAPSQSGLRSDLTDGAGELCFPPVAGSPATAPFIRRGRVSPGTPSPADFAFRSHLPK